MSTTPNQFKITGTLAESWPQPEEPFARHLEALHTGISVIKDNLVLPSQYASSDIRVETAYAHLAQGGKQRAVGNKGTFGSGKTDFGNLVMGEDARFEVSAQDTPARWYGNKSPLNNHEFRTGKATSLEPKNPRLFANEVTQAPTASQRELVNPFFEGEYVVSQGVPVPTANAVYYATSNFPGSPGVHEQDGSTRSRMSMELLSGDSGRDMAIAIHKMKMEKANMVAQGIVETRTPLLPPAAARAAFRHYVQAEFPISGTLGKDGSVYMVSLLEALEATGLVEMVSSEAQGGERINRADGRSGTPLIYAAQSRALAEGVKHKEIDVESLRKVAALTLPNMLGLSRYAKGLFREQLQHKADGLEQAVAIRRLIARVATVVYLEQSSKPFTAAEIKAEGEKAMHDYSYANPEAINKDGLDIDAFLIDAMYNGNKVTPFRKPQSGRTTNSSRTRRA